MRSVTERRYINGKKCTKAEREAMELSVAFLARKYETARKFFLVIRRLRLCAPEFWAPSLLGTPFGITYLADKLTQRVTFGKYDGTSPERGSRIPDPNSVCDCPAWFSESLQVDKD